LAGRPARLTFPYAATICVDAGRLAIERKSSARHLTLVRQPQKLPVVLTPGEVARLIEAAPSPKTGRPGSSK
jgi:hypothetical protein